MTKLKVLDLFSGIGGFSLGLERTGGFETVAFCEIEEFPRKVLAKHWPEVPCYNDVRELSTDVLERDGISVDVICGGFPCQDLSRANGVWSNRPGLEGERSGLWREYARLIREIRPKYVIVENVTDLLGAGFGIILGDLASCGYDAEWDCIPATFVGGKHYRERVWLVSYTGSERLDREHGEGKSKGNSRGIFDAISRKISRSPNRKNWLPEPAIPRVVNGVPRRMERIGRTKGIGNSVVPDIPELLGEAILEFNK